MMFNILLFVAGILIYSYFGLVGTAVLAALTAVNWLGGLLTARKPKTAAVFIAFDALVLAFAKFFLPLGGIVQPLGFSYYTFQFISYIADVKSGKAEAERNFITFAFVSTYIPKMFFGPIEKYTEYRGKLLAKHKITLDSFNKGVLRIMWGLFKKLVIAGRVGQVVSYVVGKDLGGAYVLAALIAYSVQLYSDFSGGIDIVCGVSSIWGVSLSENFDRPYFSQSVREFWRRWHITLGAWLRDYIYIPLGGSRKGKIRKIINTLVTFLVSGLWHGTAYILWGFFHGIGVCFGDKFKTKCRALNIFGTYVCVTLLWAFFVWPTGFGIEAAKKLFSLVTVFNYGEFFSSLPAFGISFADFTVMCVSVAVLWIADLRIDGIRAFFEKKQSYAALACGALLGLAVLVFGVYGIGFEVSGFIYGRL